MDDQLDFSSDQDLRPLPDLDTTSTPSHLASFHHTTWPLSIYTMPDQNHLPTNGSASHSPLSATFDMDLKPVVSSSMGPLHSPAFDFSQSMSESSLHPSTANASAPLGLSPSMATSMATLQLT